MSFYVGDYIADTGHLSTLEHGAYILLIFHYWQKGKLPTDDNQLARVARLSVPQWRKIKPVIQAFFFDGWKHRRIEFELTEAARRSAASRAAGIASGEARRNARSTTAEQPFNGGSTEREPLQSPSQSPSQSKELIKEVPRETVKPRPPRHGAISADKLFVYFKRGTAEFEAYAQDYKEAKGDEPEATSDGRWFRWAGETNFLEKKGAA